MKGRLCLDMFYIIMTLWLYDYSKHCKHFTNLITESLFALWIHLDTGQMILISAARPERQFRLRSSDWWSSL